MIKVINMVSLLAAPILIVNEINNKGKLTAGVIITSIVLVLVVIGAIAFSKKGGLGKKTENAAKF
jgi:K(+)-stimulated pyrophosphate-energized sodium pump